MNPGPARRPAPAPRPRRQQPKPTPQQPAQPVTTSSTYLLPRPLQVQERLGNSTGARPKVKPTSAATPKRQSRDPRLQPRERLHLTPQASSTPKKSTARPSKPCQDKTVDTARSVMSRFAEAIGTLAKQLSNPVVHCTSKRTVHVNLNQFRSICHSLLVGVNCKAGFPLTTSELSSSIDRVTQLLITDDAIMRKAAEDFPPLGTSQRRSSESR